LQAEQIFRQLIPFERADEGIAQGAIPVDVLRTADDRAASSACAIWAAQFRAEPL
jgi:hypothetical protein